MKKRYALLLTAAFSMAVTCNAMAAEDVTGIWYGNMYGMPLELTLDESGTYSMTMDGEEGDTGNWELDGETFYMDKGTDDELSLAYDGETLSIEEDGMELMFSRDPEAAAGFVPAEARTDSELEEFAGHWTATQISVLGMTAPLEMFEVENLDLDITDNKVKFILAGGDTFGELEVADLEGELADGVFSFVIETGDEDSEDSETWAWSAQLLEDGMMSLSTEMEDEPLIFYMEVAEVETEAEIEAETETAAETAK